jgi:hypothetical protein
MVSENTFSAKNIPLVIMKPLKLEARGDTVVVHQKKAE